MSHDDIILWRNIAIIPCIVAVLWCLSVILCREWVKDDLREKIYEPISIRWRPFACTRLSCYFKVVYKDFQGDIHQANCRTTWLRRRVTWLDDKIVEVEI
jgi:hypothetical protein